MRNPTSSLADVYDPNTMPPVLTKAHAAFDSAGDKLYCKTALPDNTARVAFLFELYGKKTAGEAVGGILESGSFCISRLYTKSLL